MLGFEWNSWRHQIGFCHWRSIDFFTQLVAQMERQFGIQKNSWLTTQRLERKNTWKIMEFFLLLIVYARVRSKNWGIVVCDSVIVFGKSVQRLQWLPLRSVGGGGGGRLWNSSTSSGSFSGRDTRKRWYWYEDAEFTPTQTPTQTHTHTELRWSHFKFVCADRRKRFNCNDWVTITWFSLQGHQSFGVFCGKISHCTAVFG